jgi:hypothetical protein
MRIEVREELERAFPSKAIVEDDLLNPRDPNYPQSRDGSIAYKTRLLKFAEVTGETTGNTIDPRTFEPVGTTKGLGFIQYNVRLWDYGDRVNCFVYEQKLIIPDGQKSIWEDIDPDGTIAKALEERREALKKMESVSVGEY